MTPDLLGGYFSFLSQLIDGRARDLKQIRSLFDSQNIRVSIFHRQFYLLTATSEQDMRAVSGVILYCCMLLRVCQLCYWWGFRNKSNNRREKPSAA